jgi:hypothetical protein
MSMNSIRSTFYSYYDVSISHEQKMNILKEFFKDDLTFKFRKGHGNPSGIVLFLDFFPSVDSENKDAFLRNVWAAFSHSKSVTGKHPWAPVRGPLFGHSDTWLSTGNPDNRTRLFREGFLKYEACLAVGEPNFAAMANTSEYWWGSVADFLQEVINFGSANASSKFLNQFYSKLREINSSCKSIELEDLKELKEGIEKKSLEIVIMPLIRASGLKASDFRRISLHMVPNGIITTNFQPPKAK